jgi:hypothetical protein
MVSNIYYSLTPREQAEFRKQYPDAFPTTVAGPEQPNEGERVQNFDKYAMTGEQVAQFLQSQGLAWSPVATRLPGGDTQGPGYGFTSNGAVDVYSSDKDRREFVAQMEDQSQQGLTDDQKERLALWKDFTQNDANKQFEDRIQVLMGTDASAFYNK